MSFQRLQLGCNHARDTLASYGAAIRGVMRSVGHGKHKEPNKAQNRELFIHQAVKTLYDYNHNGLRISGLTGANGGVPLPPSIDTGVLVVTKANVGKVLAALDAK